MKKTILMLVILLFSGMAAAEYVGTAPGVKDLGTIERGQNKLVKFYIVTNVQDVFQVNPSLDRPQASFFTQNPGRYDFKPSKASQEDISSWVEFDQESFRVDPNTERVISLENGGVANAQGEVSFVLKVPENAEPGYHAGAVNLNPELPSDGPGGTGVSTFGLTQFIFVFKVPGKAVRDVKVSHLSGFRTGEDRARIDFIVRNNGSVTTRLASMETKVFNKFGNLTGEITTGGQYLKPGETRVVSSVWTDQQIQEGQYRVRGELNYLTGSTFLDSSIDLQDYTGSLTIEQPSDGEKTGPPWWIIVMLLILLGALTYSLGVEPVWILVLVAMVGLSAYIWWSDLPVYLIAGILILTGVVFYRWS